MSLEVTTITLPFDPLLDSFPDERVRDFLADKELLSVESFHFVHAGRPYWSLCLGWRRRQSGDEPGQPGAGDRGTPIDRARQEAIRELLSELDERERAMYDRLRSRRRETAGRAGHAPYMVFTDQTLIDLVRRRPRTLAGLAAVKGLGEKKLAAYGKAVLEVLNGNDARPQGRGPTAAGDPVAGPDGVDPRADAGDAEALAAQPGSPDRRADPRDPRGSNAVLVEPAEGGPAPGGERTPGGTEDAHGGGATDGGSVPGRP
jgi:hypothetical protein